MSADLLARLIAAGTPPELIAEVAMLAARAEKAEQADPVAERRRAWDRDYRAERRAREKAALSGGSGGCRVDTADNADATPCLDKETSPRPPKEINPIPRAANASARGTVLPVDWRPIKLGRDTASGQIIERRGQDWAKRCLETFENHWRAKAGKDATKRDWQATWANWVIEQDRRDGRNGSGNRQLGVQPSGIGRTAEAALDVFGPGVGGAH